MGELTPDHLAELIDHHAIAADVAEHVAESAAEGIVFTWYDNVTVVRQLRRDPDKRVEGRPKYEWPEGVPLILNRWREPGADAPVLLVEGTCQHLAVASYTAEPLGVYGMVGCWGWSKTDLSWARGREVIVAFDADLTSNRKVWEAAKSLGDQLATEGATGVRFIKPPGRAKEGLDDVLARRPYRTRVDFIKALIDHATGKLGRAPAAKVAPSVDVVAAEIRRAQPVALTLDGKIAVYANGAYRRDQAAFNTAFTRVVGENYRHALRADVEGYLAGVLYGEGAQLPDRAPSPLLNVANGMLDLTTGTLQPHDPRYLSSVQLPVNWDARAVAPIYEAWLDKQVGPQAEDLEECVGTMLDPSRTPTKALFLFGPTRSGKSTFVRLATALAGRENTSAVTLTQLAESRFAAANVHGKILNAAAELRAGHVEDVAIFKQLTGHDPIEAEKKFVQAFKFNNQALFIFAANELPTVGESSRAYSERIKPFRFGRSFAGAENPRIEEIMLDELSGILTRWVLAWRRWHDRGAYLPNDPQVGREFEARSDRVRLWVELCCRVVEQDENGVPVHEGSELSTNMMSTRRELARQFMTWSAQTGGSTMAERKIIDRLTSINGVYDVRSPNRGRGLNIVILPFDQWRDEFEDVRALRAVLTHPPLLSVKIGQDQGEESERKERYTETAPTAPPAPPTLLPAETSGQFPAVVLRNGQTLSAPVNSARAALIKVFRDSGSLTVDVETSGYPVGHRDHQLRTVQLGGPESAWVFDLRHDDPEARALIRDLLAVVPRLHAHSATADLVPLTAAGLCDESAWARMYDTVIPAKLADPQSTGADPGLKQLAGAVLGEFAVAPAADVARAALFKTHKWKSNVDLVTPVAKSGWAQVDPADPVMLTYAASDVLDTAALAGKLSWDLPVLERERAVERITARVTHRGLALDLEHIEALRGEHQVARDVASRIVRAFGIENPGSNPQVAARLAALGVNLPRTPTGRPSVAAAVLERLRETPGQAGELVAAVLDYRHHDTVLGPFLEPYRQLCLNGDGRARPTIYTLGTDTGRMSCVRPNLQQLPREGGIRACITADPGYMIVSADFSGVELRVAAALSGDENLRRMLAEGADLHGLIAKEVWGPEWTKANRYAVKRLVFGRLYGGGIPACAAGAGVSESVAASAIDVLDSFTPGLSQWSRQLREMARAGAVAMPTYAGRVIHLVRDYPHKAPNYAIQGTARELLVDALLRWDQTPWAGSVVLPVHDEVLALVPAEQAPDATAALVAVMTTELHGVAIVAEPSSPSFAWQDAV